MVFRLDGDDDALGYLDRLGERRNVERARVDCSYRVIKALRPSEPFAPFVGVLKLCMEAPLNVKAAINLSDDFQRNGRSEKHTSELQSLMRISYAVFCLKKKKNTDKNNETRT